MIAIIQPNRSLGVIPLGSHMETFEVTNAGSDVLTISELKRSCSCTKTDIDLTSIPPGETARIRLTISPKETETKTASVTIHSNDPRTPTTRITLDWTARGAASADIHELDFGLVRPNVRVTRTFRIERNLLQIPANCKTLVRSVPPRMMQAELKDSQQNSNLIEETWEVAFQADENFKDHSGRLHLTFEGSEQGGLSLPVIWSIRKLVEASPSRLFLGVGAPSEKVSKTIELSSDPGTAIRISKIENTIAKLVLDVSHHEKSPEITQVDVVATLPEEAGNFVGNIRVEFNSPSGVVIDIPVACVVKRPSE